MKVPEDCCIGVPKEAFWAVGDEGNNPNEPREALRPIVGLEGADLELIFYHSEYF